MDPKTFCSMSKVMIIAGKGGVGKTTVSAAMAMVASGQGLRTLVVDIEGGRHLPALFGLDSDLTYEVSTLQEPGQGQGGVWGRLITPDAALSEYLEDRGLSRVSKRMTTTGTLELVSTAVPGIKDVLVLGKVKQMVVAAEQGREDSFDLIVVDAPAAGHAVSFLSSSAALADAVGGGPIHTQAQAVLEMTTDASRCQVLLVTLAEETPVNEVVETAFFLEDSARVHLGPVVVNCAYQVLDLPSQARTVLSGMFERTEDIEVATAATELRLTRQHNQQAQIARLAGELPLPQLRCPQIWTTDLGPQNLGTLTDALRTQILGLDDQLIAVSESQV